MDTIFLKKKYSTTKSQIKFTKVKLDILVKIGQSANQMINGPLFLVSDYSKY